MDVFSTVAGAITLAERVWKLIDDYRKAPERLLRLQHEVKSLQSILVRIRTTESLNLGKRIEIEAEVAEIERILQKLLHGILKLQSKPSQTNLSRHFRALRIQMGFGDLDELAEELQKRKASLNLAVGVVGLGMFSNILPGMAQASNAINSMNRKTIALDSNNMTAQDFLNSLNAPNYVDDQFRIKEPAKGTAAWIYECKEYLEWANTEQPLSTLHLVGKMGSGKSVLMKSVIQRLRSQTPKPTRYGSAVFYYFCTCLNRTDTPVSILKGFVSQLVIGCDGLFDDAIVDNEIFRVQRSPDASNWSFETLWQFFTTLIRFSHFSNLYFAVDALDECEPTGLGELLQSLVDLVGTHFAENTKMKLLYSSRAHNHILTSLEVGESSFRVFIQPDIVAPDIRISIQDDLAKLKKLLSFGEEEIEKLQEALLEKSDGMFLWASLALKEVMALCYGITYEGLNQLIHDLPSGLKGLYDKSWIKLLNSLPSEQVSLAKRVLVWLLLAKRPLTIPELTMALAVKPSEKRVPSSKQLLCTLSGFVQTYLTPFVEVSEGAAHQQPDANQIEFVPAGPRLRLVHHSAQEYLSTACNGGNTEKTIDSLNINPRKGHESIARVCIAYLRCEELQLGWAGLEHRDPEGWQIMKDEIKNTVRKRLESHTLLDYAALNWAYHVRQTQFLPIPEHSDEREDSNSEDIFQFALEFLHNHRSGFECAIQVTYLSQAWEDEFFFGPGPALSHMVAADISVLVRRLLDDPAIEIDERAQLDQSLPLHYAAYSEMRMTNPGERCEILEMLLERGADINCKDIWGNTPLHCASEFPLPDVVKALLEKGADVSIKNMRGETPLNQLDVLGYRDIVEMLIRAGAGIEIPDKDGYLPVLKAASSSSWDTVQLLLQSGVDPISSDPDGITCLHIAAESGEIRTMELLLDCHVPVDIKSKAGDTPLHFAARGNQIGAARLLILRGAESTVSNDNGALPIHVAAELASPALLELFLDMQPDVDSPGPGGETSLFFAAMRDFPDNVQLLLQRGANVEARSDLGYIPLHAAISNGKLESAMSLLDHGSPINSIDSYGISVLATASRSGNLKVVQVLIESGAMVSGASNMGAMTPLHMAAFCGHTDVVEYLIQHGAPVEHPGPLGMTPLMYSIQEGHLETSELLLSGGADVNKRGDNITALDLACYKGHLEAVRWLIDKGADATQTLIQIMIPACPTQPQHADIVKLILENGANMYALDMELKTAPFQCILWDRQDILEVLLKHGADINMQNSRGETLIVAAIQKGSVAMVKFLLDNGADPTISNDGIPSGIVAAVQASSFEILEHLQHVPITEEVLRAATAARSPDSPRLIALLLDRQGCAPVTEDVVALAAANPTGGPEIMTFLFDRQGDQLLVTRIVVKAAAANRMSGKEIMRLLLNRRTHISITEDILESAVGNVGCGLEILKFLLDQRENHVMITEDVVTAAAGNWDHGSEIITFLLHRKLPFPITENAVISAAANKHQGPAIMALFSDKMAGQLPVSENALEAAGRNWLYGDDVIPFLLNQDVVHIQTAKHLLVAVAGNESCGSQIMQFLLDRYGDQLMITRDVLKAAAGNALYGDEITRLLLQMLEHQIQSNHGSLTPFINACWNGDIPDVEVHLARYIDPHAPNPLGWTLLHAACWKGHAHIVKLLLDHGTDATMCSMSEWTPFDIAFTQGHVDLVRLLYKQGCGTIENSVPTGFVDIKRRLTRQPGNEKTDLKYFDAPPQYDGWHSACANSPISVLEDVFYFEVEILYLPLKGTIGIGICREGFPATMMPGWQETSWGYHSDNGKAYHAEVGHFYGDAFRERDIIGCLLKVLKGELCFTKNGKSFGVAFRGVFGRLFPVVTVLSLEGGHVRATFTPPFRYGAGGDD